MNELRLLANRGATILILHHRSKAEASKFRGSTDILAGVDLAYTLEKDDEGTYKLNGHKNRLDKEFCLSARLDLTESFGFVLQADEPPANKSKTDGLVDQLYEIVEANPNSAQSKILQLYKDGKGKASNKKVYACLKKFDGTYWQAAKGPRRNSTLYRIRNTPFKIEET